MIRGSPFYPGGITGARGEAGAGHAFTEAAGYELARERPAGRFEEQEHARIDTSAGWVEPRRGLAAAAEGAEPNHTRCQWRNVRFAQSRESSFEFG